MFVNEAIDATRESYGHAFERALERATRLFEEIADGSRDVVGVTRDPFGKGEQLAHDILIREGKQLGLEVHVDEALNTWLTWPGKDRNLPRILLGSHLDSVPRGGNFDGLAGVLAALAVVDTLKAEARNPRCDVVVLALRGEENAWFGAQHVGSRAVLGKLPKERLDSARRLDDRRTLREHMVEAGADVERIAMEVPLTDLSKIAMYLECHIEQGPALLESDLALGLVTAIRGNRRCVDIVCRGEYGHAGVVPRIARRDAVTAVADLTMRVDRYWKDVEAAGGDMVATIGRFNTDAAHHGVTVIPGEVRFCLDVRAHDESLLEDAWAFIEHAMLEVAQERGVTFESAPVTADSAVSLHRGLRRLLKEGCRDLGIATMEMASGAGHDVGDFAQAGIPSALVFIRNENGSHNPAESMEMADFAEAVRLMAWAVDSLACIASSPMEVVSDA